MGKSKEVRLAEISRDTERFVQICDIVKTIIHGIIITILGICAAYVMVVALKAPNENINAFAKCLKELHLSDIIKYIAIAICGGGWYIEHKRNNKLVRKEGELRHEKEYRDPVNTKSGLDEFGATPNA